MDCSEPIPSFLDNDAVFDDMYGDVASWDVANLVEDASITGLTFSKRAFEGPSGDLQNGNDQGLESMALLESGVTVDAMNPMKLFTGDEFRVDEKSNWLEHYLDKFLICQDPPDRNELQSFPADPVAAYFGDSAPSLDLPETDQLPTFTGTHAADSAPCLDVEYNHESTSMEARSTTGQLIQSYQDPMESRFISAYQKVERISTEGDQHEPQDLCNILACIICGNYSDFQIVRPCGHAFCQHYCRETWIQGEGQACPDCWYTAGEENGNVSGGLEVDFGSNVESRTDYEYAQELIIHQQEYQPGLAPAQDLDSVQCETEELSQTVQELALEYQPALQEAEGEYFQETLPNGAAAESGPSILLINLLEEIASTPKQPKQQHGSRKRGRETLVVDHNGIAMRYDGSEERFTAYYRPSYWTEDDSSVFLGEYPTHEAAADAHNLVALLHEGRDAPIILPYTADRYTGELRRWEGKHHVDLVCALRLRGRGLLKDGGVNYKHVGRRWSGKKKGTRYFSTVSDDPACSSTAKTSKPKRTFLTTFDTPEQAAQYADQVLVKRRGREAWTNFPLSSYIDLPLTFLPISNNFRDNLTYKRSKA